MSMFGGDLPNLITLTPDGPLASVQGVKQMIPLSDRPQLDVFQFMGCACEVRGCTLLDVLRILGTSRHQEAMSLSLFTESALQRNVIHRLWAAALMEPEGDPFDGAVVIQPESLEVDEDMPTLTRYHLHGEKEDEPQGWALEFTPMAELSGCPFRIDTEIRVMDWTAQGESWEDRVVHRAEQRPTLFQVVQAIVYEMTWFGPMLPDGISDVAARGEASDVWKGLQRAHAECERQIALSS